MTISIIILIIDCIILIVLIRKAGSLTQDITFSSERNIFNIIINGLEYGLIFWLLFMGVVLVAGILDTKYKWTLSKMVGAMAIGIVPGVIVTLGVYWNSGLQKIYINILQKILNKYLKNNKQ